MRPQLLLQDFQTAGRNNGAIGKTRSRLEKSASWRRQRIVVILPADATIATKVALSHWNLVFPPNNGVARVLAVGMEVGEAYSNAIEQILAHPELSQFEFLCTIEHDNMPPSDGVLRLIERMEANPKLSAISGLYYTKGGRDNPIGVAQIWGAPSDAVLNFRPQLPDVDGGLVECCGIGQGFALFRLKMFRDKRLRRPWFVTEKKNGIMTQDLYFWTDARKYGYRCAVDCSCKVGHYSLEEDFVY